MTGVNIFMGTTIAWVLVRDHFPGKQVLEVVIDIPLALPTIVAGLVSLACMGHQPAWRGLGQHADRGVLGLFVRDAAVHRAHRAAGSAEIESGGGGGASLGATQFTIFRRVILPSLTPAIASGAALSFCRVISEYGSLVLLSGNLPYSTEVASVRILSYIEGQQ